MSKNIDVNGDTSINMSTTYRRGSKKPKRVFNFVIKTMMMSTAMVSSVLGGAGAAFASEAPTSTPVDDANVAQVVQQQDAFADEATAVSNLKMANKVLDAALKTNQFNKTMYDNIMKKLVALDVKLSEKGEFNDHEALVIQLHNADNLLGVDISAKVQDQNILDAQGVAYDTLVSVKAKAGVDMLHSAPNTVLKNVPVASVSDDGGNDETPDANRFANAKISTVSNSKISSKVSTKSVAKKNTSVKFVKTKLGNKTLNLNVKSVQKDGKYFVHSIEVLKQLGVKVSYNSKTKILKINNAGKTITVKKGSQYAYQGKTKYKLSTTVQNINGRLYVPHDIISKVTNYKTKVSSGTLTITKKVSLGGVTNNDNSFNSVVEHKNNPSVSKKIYNVNASNKTLGNSYGEKDVASYKKLDKYLSPFAEKSIEYANKYFGDNSKEMKAFDDYYNKGVSYDSNNLSREERFDPYVASILEVEDIVGGLKNEGVSSKTAEKVYHDYLTANYFTHSVLRYASDNYYDIAKINNNNDSLYGFLHGKGGNCRTDAQLLMFIHNKLGNETIGLANAKFNHVSLVYKVNGTWIKTNTGDVMTVHEFTGTEIYNLDAHY